MLTHEGILYASIVHFFMKKIVVGIDNDKPQRNILAKVSTLSLFKKIVAVDRVQLETQSN